MTIAIGLLCDGGKTAIMISDREISQPAVPNLGYFYRNQATKYRKINKTSMAVFSGPIDSEVLNHHVILDGISASEVAVNLSKSYIEIRKSKIENFILIPLGIESLSKYLQEKTMQPTISIEILKQVQNYQLSCEFLICSYDESGTHLFHVANPGSYFCYDESGYRSIGIGAFIADSAFAYHKYTRDIKYDDAIKIGIEAKKRSEILLGVGIDTDIWKIDKSGISEIIPPDTTK